jgi:hypothetical protein
MNKTQQKKFVRDLSTSIVQECLGKIRDGQVPENWDGHELRCWLADKFEDAASMSIIRKEPRSKAAKEYRNTIATTTL